MSSETVAVSAQLRKDSKLAEDFEEYQEANSMTSRSEAVRHLMRAGLESEMSSNDDRASDVDADQADADVQSPDINLIRGNEPILAGLAYVIGSDGFLAATTTVAGQYWGSILFVVVGVLILLSLAPMMYSAIRQVSQMSVGRAQTDTSGGDV